MRSAIRSWLEKPHAARVLVLLGLLLFTPSLSTGLIADDFFHALVLSDGGGIEAIPRDPMALFSWADGNEARARAMMEVGMTGWWTDPSMVMSYLRPVSVATHWLDHRLWPGAPGLMHLHSLLWFGLALWLAARFYGRVSAAGPAFIGCLALALFAFDDAHAMTVAWISNRNAVIGLCFGLGALLLHQRGAGGQRGAAAAAPVALLAALLSAEAALATCAYLFSYALFLDPRGRRVGLLALLPHVVVGAAWTIVYKAGGYGAHGSGLVVDPATEPLRFLQLAAERLPVLLTAQFALPPSDLWEFYPVVAPYLQQAVLAFCLLLLALLLLLVRPLLRLRATARFWALGCLLAALPVCAQFPHDRLLLFVGLGGSGLVAELLASILWPEPGAPRTGRLRTTAAVVLAFLHLALAPLWLPLRSRGPADVAKMMAVADRSIDSDPGVTERTVVILNPPIDAYAGYIPTMRAATGRPRPARIRWLATGVSGVELTRLDARTLQVRPEAGFLSLASETMQRGRPMALGQVVQLSDLRVEVMELTDDGRPALVQARFAEPLESRAYSFLSWSPGGFRPQALPAVGQTLRLPKADFLNMLP